MQYCEGSFTGACFAAKVDFYNDCAPYFKQRRPTLTRKLITKLKCTLRLVQRSCVNGCNELMCFFSSVWQNGHVYFSAPMFNKQS